jgi:hypothetical protein
MSLRELQSNRTALESSSLELASMIDLRSDLGGMALAGGLRRLARMRSEIARLSKQIDALVARKEVQRIRKKRVRRLLAGCLAADARADEAKAIAELVGFKSNSSSPQGT